MLRQTYRFSFRYPVYLIFNGVILMDKQEYERKISEYLHRARVAGANISRKNFSITDSGVQCQVGCSDISGNCGNNVFRVPSFAKKLKFESNFSTTEVLQQINISLYASTHNVDTRSLVKVAKLEIIGDQHIEQQQYNQLLVTRSISAGGNTSYIGSYAFYVKDGCIVDIQKLKNCELDARFLFIKDFRGGSSKSRIICNEKQFKQLKGCRGFAYSKILVTDDKVH